MNRCESCTSCGMPFGSAADHALGKESIPYCAYCADSEGKLRPYSEVLEATAGYYMSSQGLDPQAARKMAEQLLKNQPAWK